MKNKQIFRILSEQGRFEEALEEVMRLLADSPTDDGLWYEAGRLNWQLGRRAQAITAYNHAVELNPASPAAEALSLVSSIMDFYNPDLLNP